MRFYLSNTLLTLAWFSVTNALGTLVARAVFEMVRRRAEAAGRAPGPQTLFAIRMLPLVLASMFAFAVFLPVHWVAESREGTESFGTMLYVLAGVSLLLGARSAIRIGGAMRACRALRRSWRQPASGGVIEDGSMPGMSLAGIFRTKVMVGRPVLDALSQDELEVAVAHEIAHQRSRDNVKRFAMFAAADFLGFTRTGRELERMWNAAVECDADAVAVNGDAKRAANLASALLKVARLRGASSHVPGSPVWSTFYQAALLELRVRRLVTSPAAPSSSSPVPALLLSLMMISAYVAWTTGLSHAVHEVSEVMVRLIP
ncbi:MAG: M48 family metalloprotease [Vicinamibacterales bacterium]